MNSKHVIAGMILILLYPIVIMFSWLGKGPLKIAEYPTGTPFHAGIGALVIIVLIAIFGVVITVYRTIKK